LPGRISVLVDQPATVTSHRPHSLRMAVVCVAGALLAGLAFTLENTFVHLTSVAMAAGVGVPIWYRWFQGRLDWFEPIHVVGTINFVFFGLASIWLIHDPLNVAYDKHLVAYVPRAAFYCLLGQWAMLIAYFGPWHPDIEANEREIEWPTGYLFLGGIGAVGFLGHFASAMVERSSHLASRLATGMSPIAQLAPLFLFAWGLGWLLYYSGRSTRVQRLILFGALSPCAAMVCYMTVSDKSIIMTMIGIPIIARWYCLRRVPWTVLIVLLLVLVFVVFPLYNTFRWSDPHASNAARLETTYQTVQSWGTDQYLRFSLDAFKYRMALINSVAVVVRDTGRWVPFARGRTIFMPTMTYLVPRYLWPDKPIAEPGREFGRLFRVTNYWSRDTYVASTIPGELYWNFHVPGVVIGMALYGYLIRWLYGRFGGPRRVDPVRHATHILILVMLAHTGSSIAGDGVVLVRLLVMLLLIRWLGRRFEMLAHRAPEAAQV